ncbi:MAG: DinB family protein, partial [Flavitalea sp.]
MEKNPVSQLNRFQSTIDKWINALEHFSFEQLSFKPANGGWSLGQLYQHILDDTNWYFKQLKIAMLDKDHINSEVSDEAKSLFVKGSF